MSASPRPAWWRGAEFRSLAPALLVGAALALQGLTPLRLAALAWIAGTLLLVTCRGAPLLQRAPHAPGLLLLGLSAWVGGLALLVQGGSPAGVGAWLTALLLPSGYLAYACAPDKSAAMGNLHLLLATAVFLLCVHVLFDFGRGVPFPASLFVQKNSLAAWLALAACLLSARWLTATRLRDRATALAAVAMAVSVIALNGSRAVLLALLVGGLVFVLLVPFSRVRRRLAALAAVVLFAAASAELASGGRLAESISAPVAAVTVAQPAGDGSAAPLEQKHLTSLTQRLAIWHGAAAMLKDMPWHGYGPGSYRLEYPRYAVPADRSTQQYAHNDPLQILLEWGYPGALLVMMLVALGVAAALRSRALAARSRIEAAGLAAGLACVAAHSLVSYNFFVPATLVFSGVAAARLIDLAAPAAAVRAARPAVFSRGGARAAGGAALVLLTAVTGCLAAMDIYYRAGARALAAGELGRAATAFSRSYSAWPGDLALTGLAMTYLAGVDAAADESRRLALLEQANYCLDEARIRGPLNPLVPLARSEWALRLAGTGAGNRIALADRFLEQALTLNPRFHAARLARARLLADAGKGADAADVLEAGLRYSFPITAASLAYLDELLRLRGALGRSLGAEKITALRAELALKLRV